MKPKKDLPYVPNQHDIDLPRGGPADRRQTHRKLCPTIPRLPTLSSALRPD